MIPKFSNPHSRSQNFELVSRAQLRFDAEDPADTSGSDVEVANSKRKLHELLFSEFGEFLSTPRKKKRCKGDRVTAPDAEDGAICMYPSNKKRRLMNTVSIVFRLLSSSGGPRIISTASKPPPQPK
jgi:hypothetical protein